MEEFNVQHTTGIHAANCFIGRLESELHLSFSIYIIAENDILF